MRRLILITGMLVMLCLMAVGVAAAADALPCDANGNGVLTNSEVTGSVLSYMKGDGSVKLDDVRDAAHVLMYWDGTAFNFVDRRNNNVTVYRTAKRVVDIEGSYGPMTLVALGAEDKMIGVTDYAKTHPADLASYTKDKPAVGGSTNVDVEKILTLNPDLVHAYSIYDYTAQNKVLSTVGVPLVQVDCYVPKNYTYDMIVMGKVLGEEENASKLIAFQDYYNKLVADRIKTLNDSQKPTVYYESPTNYMAGNGQTEKDLVINGGGIPLFTDLAKNTVVSDEEIIKRNPQVIIKIIYQGDDATQNKVANINLSGFGVTDESGVKAYLMKLTSRPGWDQIDAVKNVRVYLIHSDAWATHPSANTMYFAQAIHPELFQDITGDDVLRAWYENFTNIDFSGIYTYPKPGAK